MNTKANYVSLIVARFIILCPQRGDSSKSFKTLISASQHKVQSAVSTPALALALMLSCFTKKEKRKKKVINPCSSKFKLRTYILYETLMSYRISFIILTSTLAAYGCFHEDC